MIHKHTLKDTLLKHLVWLINTIDCIDYVTGIGNGSRAPVGPVQSPCAVRVTSVNTSVARGDGRKLLFVRAGKLSFDGETAKERSV